MFFNKNGSNSGQIAEIGVTVSLEVSISVTVDEALLVQPSTVVTK